MTEAATILRLAGGDAADAARIYALAQRRPVYRGHEVLLARALVVEARAHAVQQQPVQLADAATIAATTAATTEELRTIANAHAELTRSRGDTTVTSEAIGMLREAQRQLRALSNDITNYLWADALPILEECDLVRDRRLSADTALKLDTARTALAQEVGRAAEEIPPQAAAQKVLSDYWTARATSDPEAFDKARRAQQALTDTMAALRGANASRRAAAEGQRGYDATIAAIRRVQPAFDEAVIGATQIGDVTLAQLESTVPAEIFARLKLQTAQRYLIHYEDAAHASQAASGDSPARSAAAFIAELAPASRQRWESTLIGGPPLQEVVRTEAQRGGELTVARVERAVLLAKRIAPAKLPGNAEQVGVDRFYEIRYANGSEFRSALSAALRLHPELPMQIRTADGSRRLDLYRHGTEADGTTIIDQRDGSAIALPDGAVAAIAGALPIGPSSRGAIVVSYGASQAVMADQAAPYLDAEPVVRSAVATRSTDSQVETSLLRRITAERGMTVPQRLSKLDNDYVAFQRAFESALLAPNLSQSEHRLKSLLRSLQASAAALRRDASEPDAARADNISQAANLFFEVLRNGWGARVWAPQIRAELASSRPDDDRCVTQRRLQAVSELMRRYGVPESYRNPYWQAKMLVDGVADLHFMRVNRPDALYPIFGEKDGRAIPAERRRQILLSPASYLQYLGTSLPAWEQLALRSGLSKELWFHRLRSEAANGGVLKAVQMQEIATEYHTSFDPGTLIRAQEGFKVLGDDFSRQLDNPPTTLRPDRPSYSEFVRQMTQEPFHSTLAFGPYVDISLIGEALKARTLDEIRAIERELLVRCDAPAVQRSLRAIDATMASLVQRAQNGNSPALADSMRVLRNFRALVERLGRA